MGQFAPTFDTRSATLTDPIPNLFDKYGGAPALKPIVLDFCSRLLAQPTLHRYFGALQNIEIAEYSFALFALVLGKPVANYDFFRVQQTLQSHHITLHAYEQIVRLVRQVLLEADLLSRDVTIAINVLDIFSAEVIGIQSGKSIKSPFAGVDRRRVPRSPSPSTP